jgi:signal peptidase I
MGRATQSREGTVLDLATDLLRSCGEIRSIIRGSSMLPAIFPGDTVIVRRETARRVRRGDVVLFFRDGHFCAHRLVEKNGDVGCLSLVTRGDALSWSDPPLSENELLGRVAAVVRGGKRIELDRQPVVSERILRWAVQRSPAAVKCLLKLHSLRTRLSRNSSRTFAEFPAKPMECAR